MIIGPRGTPYENGCFIFDIYLPSDYNNVAPLVSSMTTNGGKYRYNPNLYAEGVSHSTIILSRHPRFTFPLLTFTLYSRLSESVGLIRGSRILSFPLPAFPSIQVPPYLHCPLPTLPTITSPSIFLPMYSPSPSCTSTFMHLPLHAPPPSCTFPSIKPL
jgi:hypothetical protein